MHGLEGVFVPLALFGGIAFIVKVISDNRIRQKLIDKGMVDEKVKNLFEGVRESQQLTALKWGMVLIAVGVALALANVFPYLFDGPAGVGLMFLFAGAAFIVYHFVAKKQSKE